MKNPFAASTLADEIRSATSRMTEGISELRQRITAAARALREARERMVPLEEVHPRIRQLVEHTGAAWVRTQGEYLTLNLARPDLQGDPTLPWSASESPPWGALCAAEPERAIALLEALVRLQPYEAGAPSRTRPALIAKLEKELAELEATEEQAIDAAIAAGVAIEHRAAVQQRRSREQRNAELQDARQRAEAARPRVTMHGVNGLP